VRTGPIEYLRDLLPITNFLERHLLHGSARHDHPVVEIIRHLIEILIKFLHMLDGRILRRMSLDLHEIKFHLQGCITEEANQVRLGRYLKGHQIQYDYPKGADILLRRTQGIHHEDMFLLQQLDSR